jgi:hypothetical protein
MTPTSISARVVGLATGLLLLVSAVAAPPALAKAACNNGGPGVAGTADIALVQSVSALTNGNYLDHLNVTNYGPCNVPNAGLLVTLPGALVRSSSNPNSWTCAGTTSVTCSETSTIGVPGTADIYLEYAAVAGLISACAATFTGAPSCDPAGGPVPDVNPGNNTSQVAAALLGANGTLTYGLNGNPSPRSNPANNFDHTTSVTLANGGVVNIYQAGGCPPGVPNCFLGTATINFTNVNGAKTWTLSFLASLTGKSLSKITIWNSVGGGAFSALTNCNGKNPTDPCVQDRSRSTNADGDTVFTIVVVGTVDNGMTAD